MKRKKKGLCRECRNFLWIKKEKSSTPTLGQLYFSFYFFFTRRNRIMEAWFREKLCVVIRIKIIVKLVLHDFQVFNSLILRLYEIIIPSMISKQKYLLQKKHGLLKLSICKKKIWITGRETRDLKFYTWTGDLGFNPSTPSCWLTWKRKEDQYSNTNENIKWNDINISNN